MFKIKSCCAISVALMSLWHSMANAGISINVSEDYSAIAFSYSGNLPPNKPASTVLLPTPYGDRYTALIKSSGSVGSLVVDMREVKAAAPTFLLDRIVHGEGTVALPAVPQLGYLVIFHNRGSATVPTRITVYRVGKRPQALAAKVKDLFQVVVTGLDRMYVLPDFDIYVAPCGMVNAFAGRDIVICTELIADISESGFPKAIYPILMHEIGHLLLRKWKYPGYDDEDLVDEFAAALLGSAYPESVDECIAWLKGRAPDLDPPMLASGRHSISIERAKKMKAILLNRDAALLKWAQILGKHVRPKR